MAILMMLEVPGATTEQYDRTNEIIHSIDDVPAGLLNHVAATTADGLLIVDVWESEEAFNAFFEERQVGKAMADAGAPEPKAPPRILPVHNHFEGGGTEAGVLMIADIDGFAASTYDAMISTMESHLPSGPGHPATYHVAARKENGDLLIVDLWGSAEAFGQFAAEAIGPAAEQFGMPAFEPAFVPVHSRLKGKVTAGHTA